MSAADRFLSVVRRHMRNPTRAETEACWSPDLECAPRARLEEIQSEKLAAAFDYLFEDSPYYRERFRQAGLRPGEIRDLRDLRRIPVTRKLDWIPDIEAHPPWGTHSPLREERWEQGAAWTIFSTSGTTRQPRLFRRTAHDREVLAWMAARALWTWGVRPGETALNCFYYGPSVAAWGLHHGLNLIGAPVIAGGPMPAERRARFIELVRPKYLLGTPSTLLSLANRMRELGLDPAASSVEILICAGEPGAAVPATKRRLEATWGARAHDDFGCTEVAPAPLGYTCQVEAARDDGGPINVHLMEDTHIVEVLDPLTLEPVPPGQPGTLVVSNLYSEGGPYLRYDMGDWIRVTYDPCACGRTHARAIGGVQGRSDHCLKVKGLQFFPSTFEDAIRAVAGTGDEYRVEVSARGSAGGDGDVVRVVVERAHGSRLSAHDLELQLRGILGIGVDVELLEPGALPRTEGKGVRFVDTRPTGG